MHMRTNTSGGMARNKRACIDCLTKMVNDEKPSEPNCKMKKVVVDGVPLLLLYSAKTNQSGEELRHDYGIGDLPWRHERGDVKLVLFKQPDDGLNHSSANAVTSMIRDGEDHCMVSEALKSCLTEDPDEHPESSATGRNDDDLNHSSADVSSATIREGKYRCLVSRPQPSKSKDHDPDHEHPESSVTGRNDDDLNHSPADVTSATIRDGEDHYLVSRPKPSKLRLTKDLDERPESSVTGRNDDDLNHSPADIMSATIREGEDHCLVSWPKPSKLLLTKDLDEHPESSVTGRNDDDLNHSPADVMSATIREGEDHCLVSRPKRSKSPLTKDLDKHPESSVTGGNDDDLNHSPADVMSATIREGEDHCLVSRPKRSKSPLTKDPDHEHPESSVTGRNDDDLNHSPADATSATIREGEDHCLVSRPKPSKSHLTKDLDKHPESSVTGRNDDDLNHSPADITSATIREGEDHCLVSWPKPSKLLLTKDLDEHPESSVTGRNDDDLIHSPADVMSATIREGKDHCLVSRPKRSKSPLTKDPDHEHPESSVTGRNDDDLNHSPADVMSATIREEEDRCLVSRPAPSKSRLTKIMDEHPQSSVSGRNAREIQHLTEEQRRCLRSLFQVNVTMRRELRRIDCINAILKHECLSSLDCTKVKNTVHNWITTEKRKIRRMSKSNCPK